MTFSKALIDADFLVYRIGFASEEDEERYAKARLTEWLEEFVYIGLKCEEYDAWLTGKTNFRNEVAVTVPYKGNRKELKKPKHYEALREHLIKRHGAIVAEGIEADDAVAIESVKLLNNCWIVHQDKDLDQLEGWHYNPVKNERYQVSHFEGLRNFYTQLLTGDRTDNIQGLQGIGPVKAAKALEECTNEKELLEAAWKMYQDKQESWERLLENGKLLWLQRHEKQNWCPPFNLQEQTGTST